MTNGEKIKEIFPYLTKQMLADNINIFEWWNAKYKEPTTRNCFGCKYSKDNHNQDIEECHLCMWENQYTPTTKNYLGVLDKIRAEIEELKPNNPNFKGYFEQNVALNKALEVIDKYKAECEGENAKTR